MRKRNVEEGSPNQIVDLEDASSKNKKKKNIIIDIVVIVVVLALLGVAGYLLYNEFFPNSLPILKMQVMNEDDTIDWDALLAKNPDTIGWIRISGTSVDSPVMQASDNDKYLYLGFDGEYDQRGTPFLDYQYSWDPQSTNSVIYGHTIFLDDETVEDRKIMFNDLHQYYKDPDYINKHGLIEYFRPEDKGGDGTYAIFAVIAVEAETDYRRLDFSSDEEFIEYYEAIQAASLVETDVTVSPGDEILTLSTCLRGTALADGRLAVIA